MGLLSLLNYGLIHIYLITIIVLLIIIILFISGDYIIKTCNNYYEKVKEILNNINVGEYVKIEKKK